MTISKVIKQKRIEKQLTQEDLAEMLLVSKKTISNWENGRTVGRTERVGLMSEQNQNLASDHSKKYTYRSEPKQISFRVSESEFAKLKQSAEALQMSVPAFVKAKAQNARLVTPKVAPDIAQAIARDLAKAGGNINQIAKWCNTHQHDVAPGDAQRLSENLKIMQKELQKIWQQLK